MSFAEIFSRDVACAYREVGSPVVYGSFHAFGVFIHEPTEVLAFNEKNYAVQDTTLTLTLPSGSIGQIKNNTPISVAGTHYKIKKFIPVGNGLETKIWLSETGA